MLLARATFSLGVIALILSLISSGDICVSSRRSGSKLIKLNCSLQFGHLLAQWSIPPHLKHGALALGFGTCRVCPFSPALATCPPVFWYPGLNPLFLLNHVLAMSIGTGTLFMLLGTLVEL